MDHAAFTRSDSLRQSLKRGLARQAIARAERRQSDLAKLVFLARALRPNRKALGRLAARLKRQPGVVHVGGMAEGMILTCIARSVREVEARVEGETIFRETGLIYMRMRIGVVDGRIGFQLNAVSFCCHAIERLVARSAIPLDDALLDHMDEEAKAIFRFWNKSAHILDDGDEFYPAATPGLWAGGHDEMDIDSGWGVTARDKPIVPIFSARTFLSPAEMRPTVWLRWKDDPSCRMI